MVQGRMALGMGQPLSSRAATCRLRIMMSASPYKTASTSNCKHQGDHFSCKYVAILEGCFVPLQKQSN